MTRGLGDEDPFARRQAAADKFLPPKPPPPDDEDDDREDQRKQPPNKDSNNASNSDSVGGDVDTKEKPVGSTAVEAPPPPTREPEGRTQMNARVRVNRMKALKKYQHQHRSTLQAVVDQMVDEYLERRGLLPKD
ncbi:hypothetical protein L3Q65_00035 (plasmid) [Amycolatopsis sp. FU40]|uniref:hypothetical protein n=1 Tax=Amycolatopsis sp. FU40 TaxID=2914159 RepID=UPI001F310E33|nr:hypothetical protein [Amycolatopsis sp. FU40]UKD50748.1 hypothetical protein L3Q65_00035 [Amycolatopsis sp. FU40]